MSLDTLTRPDLAPPRTRRQRRDRSAAPDAVRFVGMTDVICPKATCQVVSPTGQIMDRDEHHLTAGYSATLWPQLSDRLEAAIT